MPLDKASEQMYGLTTGCSGRSAARPAAGPERSADKHDRLRIHE